MSDHFSRPFSYDMIKDMINGMTFLSMRALHAFEIGKADLTGIPFEIGKLTIRAYHSKPGKLTIQAYH